jgi:ribulose-5-phosphate 4-epimerase/fuculose-1-phosphate aldolase
LWLKPAIFALKSKTPHCVERRIEAALIPAPQNIQAKMALLRPSLQVSYLFHWALAFMVRSLDEIKRIYAMATQLKPNSKYSEAEWTARQELAACYRIFSMYGWDELIFNHITVKVPDQEGAFLINPFGMHFGEITASSLIKIDIDGNKLDVDNPWHVNKAGFVQHSLFHRHLDDAHAIIHTHTTATMAVCSLDGGLQPTNFYACNFMGQLAYHDFEGVTVREEEGERLLKNLGDKRILMLKNHGPVVMGKTLPDAFIKYWVLQRACEIQLSTMSMGNAIPVGNDVIHVHQRDISQNQIPGGSGRAEFDAMVRKVDKIDRSWRD